MLDRGRMDFQILKEARKDKKSVRSPFARTSGERSDARDPTARHEKRISTRSTIYFLLFRDGYPLRWHDASAGAFACPPSIVCLVMK